MTRSAKQRIDGMCKLYHIDIEGAYKQGKFILETYRDLSWKTAREANYVREDLMSYCSADMDQALVYLLTFATDERRDFFESKIDALFTNHTMGGMIESAAAWVRDYPTEGNLYYNIIYLSYLCHRCSCLLCFFYLVILLLSKLPVTAGIVTIFTVDNRIGRFLNFPLKLVLG